MAKKEKVQEMFNGIGTEVRFVESSVVYGYR